ncbi:MAG: bifunctional glutamate N-acetyltransferase/amino-acid acetyltransferase ArgJ [Angustibacter sp.]
MSVTAARGFRAAGVAAGLKTDGLDVALVVNDGPIAAAAAVFTANRCPAHPVVWSRVACGDGVLRAVVLNSGGANCYTGTAGFAVTHASAERVAEAVGVDAGDVAVCSTGLIGEPLDGSRLAGGIAEAARELGGDAASGRSAATAIMTTDTVAKESSVRVAVATEAGGAGTPQAGATDPVQGSEGGWTVGGMAKGAAMLAPQLATMLVVLTTDAVVDAATCDTALRAATRVTFDRLDSDGCQSTNDTVLLLASGASGHTPPVPQFAAAVRTVCHDLAQQLLRDAEGAEHQVAIEVCGAASEDDAVEVGRAVARSALVKTAIFGRDPNWGRILAAVGTTRAVFDPTRLDVAINGVQVARAGGAGEPRERVDLSGRDVHVVVDLKAGSATATVWTTDLTHAYVHENSAYST